MILGHNKQTVAETNTTLHQNRALFERLIISEIV